MSRRGRGAHRGTRVRLRPWALTRTAARWPVVLTLALLVLVTSAAMTGITGWSEVAARDGLRTYLTGASGDALGLQIRTGQGGESQAAEAEEFFAATLGDGIEVHRSVTVPPAPVRGLRGATLRRAAYDDFTDLVTITEGEWPVAPGTGPTPAALPVDAATTLGVGVGDRLRVGEERYVVAALWQPLDPNDPRLVTNASAQIVGQLVTDQAAAGVLVVDEGALAGLPASANWTLVPVPDRITPEGLVPLSRAVGRVATAFEGASGLERGSTMAAGGLPDTLDTLARSQQAALAMRPVPLTVVAAISMLMMVQLSGLLGRQRREEFALVRSRGGSTRQLGRLVVLEAALVACLAAAAGAALVAALLAPSDTTLSRTAWLLALATALVGVAVIAAPGLRGMWSAELYGGVDDSGRGSGRVAGLTLLVVGAAALVSVWRLRDLGGTTFRDGAGRLFLDPLAVVAPAMALLAAGLGASTLVALGAAAAQRLAARRDDLDVVLAARQVARRSSVYGVLAFLVAVAVGSTALAATYSPTQVDTQDRLNALVNGAQLRAELPTLDPVRPTATPDPVPAQVRALPEVAAALPVQERAVEVGDRAARLLAVSAAQVGDVLPGSVQDLADSLAGTETPEAGLPLPDGARALTLHVTATAAHVPKPTREQQYDPWGFPIFEQDRAKATDWALSVWVMGPDGALQSLVATPVHVPIKERVRTTSTVDLTGVAGGSRLVALDGILGRDGQLDVELRVDQAVVDDGDTEHDLDADGTWRRFAGFDDESGQATALDDGLGWTARSSGNARMEVRLLAPGAPESTPVVVDPGLASELALAVGDQVHVAIDGAREVEGTVAGFVDQLPGGLDEPTVGSDLGSFSWGLLDATFNPPGSTSLWVAPRSGATAPALADVLPVSSRVVSADSRSASAVVAPASTALWLGAAVALVVAVVGSGSVVAGSLAARRRELIALRAVGVTAGAQGRWRGLELVAVVVPSIVLGLALGLVAAALTTPALARATLVGGTTDPRGLSLELTLLGLLLAGLLLVEVAVAVVQTRRTRRQALAAIPTDGGR